MEASVTYTPNNITVMVQDGHNGYREALVHFLQLSGFVVISDAQDSTEFIASIDPAHLPDIAIVNYKIHSPETLATVRCLQLHYPTLKVIINTEFRHFLPVAKMKQLGIEGLLIKADKETDTIIKTLYLVHNGERVYPE